MAGRKYKLYYSSKLRKRLPNISCSAWWYNIIRREPPLLSFFISFHKSYACFFLIVWKNISSRIQICFNWANMITNRQFGFHPSHSTLHQSHKILDEISSALESIQYCLRDFLDVSQALYKVWQESFVFKLKWALPDRFFLVLKSYFEDRHFKVKQGMSFLSYTLLMLVLPKEVY